MIKFENMNQVLEKYKEMREKAHTYRWEFEEKHPEVKTFPHYPSYYGIASFIYSKEDYEGVFLRQTIHLIKHPCHEIKKNTWVECISIKFTTSTKRMYQREMAIEATYVRHLLGKGKCGWIKDTNGS